MKTTAIKLRKGNVIEYNGKLMVVVAHETVHPGKGNSVSQIELRDIRLGNKDNVRFRTQETIELIRLDQSQFQYLFNDGENYTFMNTETYEQVMVSADIVGELAVFLQDGMMVTIETHEGEPLGIQLPDSVILEVVEAEPVIKGQTATTSYKPAILENGARVMVPPHIDVGTNIVVKTEDATYVERAKG